MPIAKRRKLVNEMKENVGASQRKFANKYRITHQYVSKIIKKYSLNYYKCVSVPERIAVIKRKIKKRYTILRKNEFKP